MTSQRPPHLLQGCISWGQAVSTVRHCEREHIHTTSTAIYFYNCSLLLLAIVLNLLLCLIYELNFILSMYKTKYISSSVPLEVSALPGALDRTPEELNTAAEDVGMQVAL